MPSVMKALSINLIKYRKQHGFTQLQLAEKLGTSRQTILRYESGEGGLDTKTLAAFAELFGVEETDLVTPEAPPQNVQIKKAEFDALQGLLANLKTPVPQPGVPNSFVEKLNQLKPEKRNQLILQFERTVETFLQTQSESENVKKQTG